MQARTRRTRAKAAGGSTQPALGRRARRKASTKARIVAAALALFRARGFERTTTSAIARKAGIAEGTVFNYFPTKDDIALYFLEQEVDQAIATVRANRRLRKAPLEERLFVLVQTQLELLGPHERFIGAAFVEALKPGSKLGVFSPSAQALQFRYLAFVQELVDEAIRRREITPAGWWTPHVFWIYYLGVLLYWLRDTSDGKQQTLAFLDRSLKIGVAMLKRG